MNNLNMDQLGRRTAKTGRKPIRNGGDESGSAAGKRCRADGGPNGYGGVDLRRDRHGERDCRQGRPRGEPPEPRAVGEIELRRDCRGLAGERVVWA